MKKNISRIALAVAALALASCAKPVVTNQNDATKRYIESFVKMYYPSAAVTPLGSYIIESNPGSGPSMGTPEQYPFLYVNYTAESLDGRVLATTDPLLQKKVGLNGGASSYCGPVIWYRAENNLMAGFDELVSMMNENGSVKALVPGWLTGVKRYADADEYFKNVDGTSGTAIYTFGILERISDINKWQIDSIGRYLKSNFPSKSLSDSVRFGHYVIPLDTPSRTPVPKDTAFRVNYVGRLLDGTVFDTNIKDTAKVYGLYRSNKEYTPSSAKISTNDGNVTVTLDGGSAIGGFSLAVQHLHLNEKIVTVFYSGLGYGTTGTDAIPSFSPLRFDIEVVE